MGGTPTRAWAQFKARVKELGGEVLEPKWLGSAAKHRVRCPKGHETEAIPNRVQQGQGMCRPCSGSDPATAWAAFKARVKELGGTVVEPQWLGKDERHRVICSEGHPCNPRPGYVRDGGGICSVCSGNDPATAWAAFKTRVTELGGTVVEPGWLGKAKPHRIICRNGHPFSPTPNNIRTGSGRCLRCVGIDPVACWEWFKARVAELGGHVVEPAWLGDGTAHRLICREGHRTRTIPSGVKQGQGICRHCAGKTWDVFYVVESANHVKFGITSGDPRPRLRTHAKDGFTAELRVIRDLPGDLAPDLEAGVRLALADEGLKPVRGREYFPSAATPLILSIVDQALGEIGRQHVSL
ncbi:hypothetical protein ACFY2Z_30155 [Streptomyces sp. NPDC001222]|uniref:hypothetical protein n=1 Tax=Streptomyces sp. NPDC001222 TaxID=3364548 RepID=UPI003683D46A